MGRQPARTAAKVDEIPEKPVLHVNTRRAYYRVTVIITTIAPCPAPPPARSATPAIMTICLQSLLPTTCLAALILVAGCHGAYTYTFNDNVIFSPGKEASPTGTAALQDPALQGCLNQYMEASGFTALDQVKLLACPGIGVETLAGIDVLAKLEQLELSDNRVSDLRPLISLGNLRVLGIRSNPVTTVTPLLELPILRFVSLLGDDHLRCDDVASLRKKLGNTVTVPLHCAE